MLVAGIPNETSNQPRKIELKILRWSLLSFALAFLIVPTYAEEQEPEPPSDGGLPAMGDIDEDEIQNSLDICPYDPENECVEAKACKKLDESVDRARTISGIFGLIAFILGVVALVLGILGSGVSGGASLPTGISIYAGIVRRDALKCQPWSRARMSSRSRIFRSRSGLPGWMGRKFHAS